MTDSEFLLLPKRELVALVQSVAGLKVQDTQQKLQIIGTISAF